jgi:hypothetical protein
MTILKVRTLEWRAPYQRISSQTMVACAYWVMFFHTAGGTYATRPRTWVTAFVCNTGKFVRAVIICPTFRPTTAWGASRITRHSLRAETHGMTLWWDWTEGIGSTWVWQTRISRFQDAARVWITCVPWFTITCFLIFSDVTVSITATWPRLTQRLHRFCNKTQHNHMSAYIQYNAATNTQYRTVWLQQKLIFVLKTDYSAFSFHIFLSSFKQWWDTT